MPSGYIAGLDDKLGRSYNKPSKNALLAKFKEENTEDAFESYPTNGMHNLGKEGDILEDIEELNEFETLRLDSKGGETIKESAALKRPKNIWEFDNDDDSIKEEDFDQPDLEFKLMQDLLKCSPDRLHWSPGTISTSSPKKYRRKSLSEYSEETAETEITEINDGDFQNKEQIDDIFGDEESGIYNNKNKATNLLELKKQKQEREAEIEEKELYKKYRAANETQPNTLKLVDFKYYEENPIDKNALESERTVEYEYTKDDLEDFEDGFELDAPIKFENLQERLTSVNRKLGPKVSMPSFNQTSERKDSRLRLPKKYKSTIDLAKETRGEYPFLNSQNKIIKKLDRIPSFYREPETFESMNHHIEVEKRKLLEKYMEISEKQYRLNQKKTKNKNLSKSKDTRGHRNIGLIRYLNEDPQIDTLNKAMCYNAKQKVWDGNDIELMRFENLNPARPLLISLSDYKNNKKQNKNQQGKMVYDPKQLKWINTEEGEEDDVFRDLPDLKDLKIAKRQSVYNINRNLDRGVSNFTTRSESTGSLSVSDRGGNDLSLPLNLVEKFYKQEYKVQRKISHWFQQNEKYNLNQTSYNRDYFWEIRRMVVEEDE